MSNSATGAFRATALTGGPWHPDHQHAGPPSALICRAIERAAASEGLTHLARLTVNLMRPAPIGECRVEVAPDYVGRNAGHYSGRLTAEGKERRALHGAHAARGRSARSRRDAGPSAAAGAEAARANARSSRSLRRQLTSATANLVENRLAEGRFFNGPCAAWFRMNHPLVEGETPSPYQRVAVAADSGNGISASLDFGKYRLRQLRSDHQSLPPTGGRMDLPRVAQPVRRQRLRTGRVRAL